MLGRARSKLDGGCRVAQMVYLAVQGRWTSRLVRSPATGLNKQPRAGGRHVATPKVQTLGHRPSDRLTPGNLTLSTIAVGLG